MPVERTHDMHTQPTMRACTAEKTVHESHVNAIVYDAKNSRLYSGDGAGVIVVWRRGGGGQGGGGAEDYGVLRKVQHADLVGKAIMSLALAPRLRRGQLLVQAHGNTLRLLDLGTYQVRGNQKCTPPETRHFVGREGSTTPHEKSAWTHARIYPGC